MIASTPSLTRFADLGLLPFTGRERELARIARFRAELDAADTMRVAMVTGEAGIGKSRLLDEAMPRSEGPGECILRVKLHLDTADAFVELIADALWSAPTARAILGERPAPSLIPVARALRRLARLRRLLLVIEDVHLLDGSPGEKFASLVAALADEPLGMILSARPASPAIRGAVEPVLALRIELPGLTIDALMKIWSELFGEEYADRVLMERLLRRTMGNPLTLRMALRAGMRESRAGGTERDRAAGLYLDIGALERSLDTSTRLLAEGMIAHLSAEEREWSARLAALGEVMSRDAARIMLGGDDAAIERLRARGVIVEGTTIPLPLGKTRAETALPIVFGHTLIHRHFLEQGRFDIDRFWDVLASGAPLHGTTPFELAKKHDRTIARDEKVFMEGIREFTRICREVLVAFRNDPGRDLYGTFEAIATRQMPLLSEAGRLHLRLRMLNLRLNSLPHHPAYDGEEKHRAFRSTLAEYLRMGRRARDGSLRVFHLNAIAQLLGYRSIYRNVIDLALWERMEAIIGDHPDLMNDPMYITALSGILSEIHRITDNNIRGDGSIVLRQATRRVEQIAADPRADNLGRICTLIYPQLMMTYVDIEGYARARHLFAQALRHGDKNDRRLYKRLLGFAADTENVEKAIPLAIDCLQRNEAHLEKKFDTSLYIDWSILLAATNAPLEEVSRQLDILERESYEPVGRQGWPRLVELFIHMGVLRLDTRWIDHMSARQGEAPNADKLFFVALHRHHLHGTIATRFEELRSLLAETIDASALARIELSLNGGAVVSLARMVFGLAGYPEETGELERSLREYLDAKLMGMGWLADLISLLILLEHAHPIAELASRLRPEIRDAIARTMEWLIETRRIVFARVFPTFFPKLFEESEIATWGDRIERELREQHARLRPATNEERDVSVSMVERIGYRRGEDVALRGIKGLRLKQLLGLMTLDAIIPRPLTRAEFFAVFADHDADDETRRNAVKVAVYQLRKLLGHRSIVQGAETPRLNRKVVRVDLIEAHESMARAEGELAAGRLKNAAAGVYGALHLLRGEVPFPTLYDQLFESAREDLETRLRAILLNTCRGLLHEGDLENCEALLRLATRQFAGDGELDEMLVRVLHDAEKRLEALRVATASEESL